MHIQSFMPRDGSGAAGPRKPSGWLVLLCLLVSTFAMVAAVYFGGTGRTPLALTGTALFVGFGGLGFDLARRRSM